MIEKRFVYRKFNDGMSSIYDKKDNEYYFDFDELEEVLNQLNLSIETFKSGNALLKQTLDHHIKEKEELVVRINNLAFELLDEELISMGKAVEISEMNYHDFLKFRKNKGNSMELQK